MTLRVASSVFLCAVVVVGCAPAALPAETTRSSAAPTVAASPTISPTDAASPTPAATPAALREGEQALDPGTYRLALPAGSIKVGGHVRTLLATVPDGWHNLDGWVLRRPRAGEDVTPVSVRLWDVDQVYRHPCQWSGTQFDPGPTAGDLAEALVDVPLRNATQPTEVTLDGYTGKYVEWSVPADIEMDDEGNFPDCDSTDDGHRDFKSWTGNDGSNRYHQGPGQFDRLWVLDVDGRLVIDAQSMPSATDVERGELLDLVESIRFER